MKGGIAYTFAHTRGTLNFPFFFVSKRALLMNLHIACGSNIFQCYVKSGISLNKYGIKKQARNKHKQTEKINKLNN